MLRLLGSRAAWVDQVPRLPQNGLNIIRQSPFVLWRPSEGCTGTRKGAPEKKMYPAVPAGCPIGDGDLICVVTVRWVPVGACWVPAYYFVVYCMIARCQCFPENDPLM